MTAVRTRLLWLAVCALVLCGCSTLPVSGEVHNDPAGSEEGANQAPYFAPPGPGKDDSPEAIVRGFLLAMQANPPSTTVARSFLSSRARASWKPVGGTIVYDSSAVAAEGGPMPSGMPVDVPVDSPGPVDPSGQVDPLDRLAKLNALRLAGGLTDEEYERQKRRLLDES